MPLSAIILRRSYIRFEFVDFGTGYYVRLWALYALFRCGEILRTSFTSFSSVFEQVTIPQPRPVSSKDTIVQNRAVVPPWGGVQVDDSLLLRKSVLWSNLNGRVLRASLHEYMRAVLFPIPALVTLIIMTVYRA
jgi:hypothetical protein